MVQTKAPIHTYSVISANPLEAQTSHTVMYLPCSVSYNTQINAYFLYHCTQTHRHARTHARMHTRTHTHTHTHTHTAIIQRSTTLTGLRRSHYQFTNGQKEVHTKDYKVGVVGPSITEPKSYISKVYFGRLCNS